MNTMNRILVSALLACGLASAGDWVLVTSGSGPISSISKADLKRVFTGKKGTVEGAKAVPILLPDASPATVAFLREVVGMTPEEYKKFWVEQQVKGEGSAPMTQKSAAAALLVAADIPGALAVVDKAGAGVKEVAVK